MTTVDLNFAGFGTFAPATPPEGYIQVGSITAQTNNVNWYRFSGGQQSVWAYDTELTGAVVYAEMASPLYGSGTGNGHGVALYNSATGLGIQLFSASSTALSLQTFTNGVMTTSSSLHTITVPAISGAYNFGIRYTDGTPTGSAQIVLNGVDVGDAYDVKLSNIKGAFSAFSSTATRGINRFTVEFEPPFSVDSINGGADIERGQQNVTYETSGFASITTITTDTSGVTVSGISDTSGVGDFDLSGYVEGQPYPILPASVEFTLGNGVDSANQTKTITILSTETAINTVGMITINSDFIGYHLQAAGRSVADGGQMVFPTTANLTINPDGSFNYTTSGDVTIPLWYRDPVNGNMYYYDVTFSENGIVIPDAFDLGSISNANPSTNYTSDTITVSGIPEGEEVLASVEGVGGSNYVYAVDTGSGFGAYTSTPTNVQLGYQIRTRMTSSPDYSGVATLTLSLGVTDGDFVVTNKADNDPDTIKFVTLSALSDIKTITGVTGSVAITIVGGQYSKNGGGFTAAAGTVVNNDTIQLSGADGATVRVTIGGKTFSWSSKGGGGGFGGSLGIGI